MGDRRRDIYIFIYKISKLLDFVSQTFNLRKVGNPFKIWEKNPFEFKSWISKTNLRKVGNPIYNPPKPSGNRKICAWKWVFYEIPINGSRKTCMMRQCMSSNYHQIPTSRRQCTTSTFGLTYVAWCLALVALIHNMRQ